MIEIAIPFSGWGLANRDYGEQLCDICSDLVEGVEYRAFVRKAKMPLDWRHEDIENFPQDALELVLTPIDTQTMILFIKKKPSDGDYEIFFEGGSEMIPISSVMQIDEYQILSSMEAVTGITFKSAAFQKETDTFEIWKIEKQNGC